MLGQMMITLSTDVNVNAMSRRSNFIIAAYVIGFLTNMGFAMEESPSEPLLSETLLLVKKLSRPIEIDQSHTKLIDLISRLNKDLDIAVIPDEICTNRLIADEEDVNHAPEQRSLTGLSIYAAMQKYCDANKMRFCIAGDFCLIIGEPKKLPPP